MSATLTIKGKKIVKALKEFKSNNVKFEKATDEKAILFAYDKIFDDFLEGTKIVKDSLINDHKEMIKALQIDIIYRIRHKYILMQEFWDFVGKSSINVNGEVYKKDRIVEINLGGKKTLMPEDKVFKFIKKNLSIPQGKDDLSPKKLSKRFTVSRNLRKVCGISNDSICVNLNGIEFKVRHCFDVAS